MANESLGYTIRDASVGSGGVALELVVEGAVVARAAASALVLEQMRESLGVDAEFVVDQLRLALQETLASQGQLVQIQDIREDAGRPLRFSGRFTHRLDAEIATGVVTYDVNTSETGPEAVAPVVRNKMRFEVHRRLTVDGTAARALVDMHK